MCSTFPCTLHIQQRSTMARLFTWVLVFTAIGKTYFICRFINLTVQKKTTEENNNNNKENSDDVSIFNIFRFGCVLVKSRFFRN